MKVLFSLLLIFFSASVIAQDCSNYYYLQNNKTIEMTISNSKGNETGKLIYTISNGEKSSNSITATLNSEFVVNGKTITKASNDVKCESGVMKMSMKIFIPPVQLEQMKTSTTKANDVYLEYPPNMNVGDQLKDGQFHMDYESTNGLKSSIDISITDRKVEDKETLTTSAGTWECYKISAKNKIVSKIADTGIPITMDVIEWYAPGFGIVKTESKTGKTEITSIK